MRNFILSLNLLKLIPGQNPLGPLLSLLFLSIFPCDFAILCVFLPCEGHQLAFGLPLFFNFFFHLILGCSSESLAQKVQFLEPLELFLGLLEVPLLKVQLLLFERFVELYLSPLNFKVLLLQIVLHVLVHFCLKVVFAMHLINKHALIPRSGYFVQKRRSKCQILLLVEAHHLFAGKVQLFLRPHALHHSGRKPSQRWDLQVVVWKQVLHFWVPSVCKLEAVAFFKDLGCGQLGLEESLVALQRWHPS